MISLFLCRIQCPLSVVLYFVNGVLSAILGYIILRRGGKQLRWMGLGFLAIAIHQGCLAFNISNPLATLPLSVALIYALYAFLGKSND